MEDSFFSATRFLDNVKPASSVEFFWLCVGVVKNTWSDFTMKKILSAIHVQSSFLDSWTFGSCVLKNKCLMTKLYEDVTIWKSSSVRVARLWTVVLRGVRLFCPFNSHALVLHIWGDGTVRRPVGLILLMPPSRIQILGYFIFTRWAANWKKKKDKFIKDTQNWYLSNPIFFSSCNRQNNSDITAVTVLSTNH